MPIYEYTCQDCGDEFELLVNSSTQPTCPSCQSQRLEKEFSTFAAHGAEKAASVSGHSHGPGCGCCCGGHGACGLN